jgi:hypothetical protein
VIENLVMDEKQIVSDGVTWWDAMLAGFVILLVNAFAKLSLQGELALLTAGAVALFATHLFRRRHPRLVASLRGDTLTIRDAGKIPSRTVELDVSQIKEIMITRNRNSLLVKFQLRTEDEKRVMLVPRSKVNERVADLLQQIGVPVHFL